MKKESDLPEKSIELLNIARKISKNSPDRSRKVGALIITKESEIISFGFNTLPDGIDHLDEYLSRPAKYDWTEHAERNAIFMAAKNGVSTDSCEMILPWFPCVPCARAIIQSGIKKITAPYPDLEDPDWGNDFKIALEMFEKTGLIFEHFNEVESPKRILDDNHEHSFTKIHDPKELVNSWNSSLSVNDSKLFDTFQSDAKKLKTTKPK